MPIDHSGGPSAPGPQFASAARRLLRPFVALAVVAGLSAGCGSGSTPLEVYQNCLRCGYDFSTPIPTAASALRRAQSERKGFDPTLAVYGRDDLS